jgi:hypothetical protein
LSKGIQYFAYNADDSPVVPKVDRNAKKYREFILEKEDWVCLQLVCKVLKVMRPLYSLQ